MWLSLHLVLNNALNALLDCSFDLPCRLIADFFPTCSFLHKLSFQLRETWMFDLSRNLSCIYHLVKNVSQPLWDSKKRTNREHVQYLNSVKFRIASALCSSLPTAYNMAESQFHEDSKIFEPAFSLFGFFLHWLLLTY